MLDSLKKAIKKVLGKSESSKTQAKQPSGSSGKKLSEKQIEDVNYVAEKAGWDFDKAKKAMKKAKTEYGITFRDYAKYGLYAYPETEIKKIYDKKKASSKKKKGSKKSVRLPEQPYMPKIASITDSGIEFYWKKPEVAEGYEVFRGYGPNDEYECIAKIETRSKGTYIDSNFDHSRKEVFYCVRSFIKGSDDELVYSEKTSPISASYRENLILEREATYIYSGTTRSIKAFIGWGEPDDVSWETSDSNIAEISNDGIISAISTGKCILTCTDNKSGKSAQTTVEVNRKACEPLGSVHGRFSYNENEKCWENKNSYSKDEAVIMMVGDMMCGKNQMKVQHNEDEGWNFNDSFEYVKNIFASSDFAVGNLETLLASGWPYMIDEAYIDNLNNCNATSRYLDAVRYAGFDAVTMSNNHNCDGGRRALLETIEQVDKYHFAHTGVFDSADAKRWFIANVNGIKVGFVAYTTKATGFNKKELSWDENDIDSLLNVFSYEKACKDIAQCRAEGAEYVVAYMHWGKKNFRNITDDQKENAKAVANAGADYIVGANPHILQAYAEIVSDDGRKVPCFYSTGNFQAFMNQIKGNRDSVIVQIKLRRNENGIVELVDNSYIPCYTFTKIHSCHWAPVALNMKYALRNKPKKSSTALSRISSAIGSEISAKPAISIKNGIINNENDFELINSMEKIKNEYDISNEEYIACGLDDYCLDKEGKFENLGKVSGVTLRLLCDTLGIDIPERYKEIADDKQTVAFRSKHVKPGDICLIIRSAEDFHTKSITSKRQYELAIERGAKLVIMGRQAFKKAGLKEDNCQVILMDSSDDSIQRLFDILRIQRSAKTVMLTGSIGKTTTKDFCYAVTKNRFDTFANQRNTNTPHQVAKHLFYNNVGNEVYIQEAGAGYRGSVRFSASMLRPDVFILTNVYQHHLQVYKTYENIFEDKSSADDYLAPDGVIITNYDDENIRKHNFKHKVLSFAIDYDDVDYKATDIQQKQDNLTFNVFERETGTTTNIQIKILGVHNVYNALAAFALARHLGLSESEIQEDFKAYRTQGVRQNLSNIGGTFINMDCYNVSEESIISMVKAGSEFELENGGRRIALIGGENKLGKDCHSRCVKFGEELAEIKIDNILFCGNEDRSTEALNHFGDAKTIMESYNKHSQVPNEYSTNIAQIEEYLRKNVKRNDFLMVKGIYYLDMPLAVDKVFGSSYSFDLSNYKDEMETVKDGKYVANLIPKFGELELKKAGKSNENVEIPDEINGYPVFRIINELFKDSAIKSINFNANVKNIGESAFEGCKGVTELDIPANVLVLENKSFAGCEGLKKINIAHGLSHIGESAFKGCTSLEEVIVPDSVGMIGDEAFECCNANVVFRCNKGSYGYEWALNNGFDVAPIEA